MIRAMSESSPSNRRNPRIEVYAQAEIRGEEVAIMAVRNVSAGGIYLEGTPQEYPTFRPGLEFELVIFGSEEGLGDDPDFNIQCRAKIIRIDEGFPGKRPPGFGCTIDPVDQDNRDRLTNLLVRASNYRVGKSR
jgi:hypothetical protein